MYWCLSAQSFACVCSLSQPGGVCKAEWCPFVCVLSKSVCGEEYRGKVYALLVSTPGASHVLLVPPLRTSSTSTFGFDLSIFRRTGTWKNSILKRNKKTGAGPFFAGLSAKLSGLLYLMYVNVWVRGM